MDDLGDGWAEGNSSLSALWAQACLVFAWEYFCHRYAL